MSVDGAALASVLALLGGCGGGDAIVIEVDGDLPIGSGVDSMCLAVADRDPGGGHFGQSYRIDRLPQTLRVEPGAASDADTWVVGSRAGVPVARDMAAIDFGGDVALRLDRCYDNPGGAAAVRGDGAGPGSALLAPLVGRGGTRLVAVGGGTATVIDVSGGALVETGTAPAPPAGAVRAVVGFDADGDCDDDVLVVTDSGAPVLWHAEGDELTVADTLDGGAVRAAAAADVDRDGDVDVMTANGSDLVLHRNDGAGRFVPDPSAITAVGFVTDATALAFGDLDGNGSVDVVVGQAAAPIRAFDGAPGGGGSFTGAPGVLPDLPVAVKALRLADADGDSMPDLWVAVAGGPARLYVDRAGSLENRSFDRLPQPPPEAAAFAVAGWDADCTIDAVVAAVAGGALWRGDGQGNLVEDGDAPGSTDAVLLDLDDDGDLDLALATPGGVTWLAR